MVDEHEGNNESKYYDIDPDDPESPARLMVYKGLRDGDRVKYVGPVSLEGTFVIEEIIQFTPDDVLAALREEGTNDPYEVNADNLEKL